MNRINSINNNLYLKNQPEPTQEINFKANLASNVIKNKGALSKSLIALGILGAASLQSCVKNETLAEPEDIIINKVQAPELLVEKFDNMLKNLGLIQEPANSIDEIKTISFECNNTKYYLQPQKVANTEIIFKQIKIGPDYKGSEAIITVKKDDNFISVINDKNNETKYIMEDNLVKSYKNVEDLWTEFSSMEKLEDNTILINFTNGEQLYVNDIKNNEEMPEIIGFTPNINPWENEEIIEEQ